MTEEQHNPKIKEFDVFFKDQTPTEEVQDASVNEIFEDSKEGLGGLVGHAIGALSQIQEDENHLDNLES